MNSQLWRQFAALNPSPPLLIGTITQTLPHGMAEVTLAGGGVLTVRNPQQIVQGSRVLVRDGVIESTAPDLPLEEGEV